MATISFTEISHTLHPIIIEYALTPPEAYILAKFYKRHRLFSILEKIAKSAAMLECMTICVNQNWILGIKAMKEDFNREHNTSDLRYLEKVIVNAASDDGLMSILALVYTWKEFSPDIALEFIASRGKLEELKYMYNLACQNYTWNPSSAERRNSMAYLSYVQRHKPSMANSFIAAASNGHINVLEWLHDPMIYEIERSTGTKALEVATEHKHYKAMTLLCQWNARSIEAFESAAKAGDERAIKILHSHDTGGMLKCRMPYILDEVDSKIEKILRGWGARSPSPDSGE